MLFSSGELEAEDLRIYTQEAVESFELEAKKGFEGPHQPDVSIKVGGHRFTERAIGVRRGILTVTR